MLERQLYEHYRIDPANVLSIGDDMLVKSGGKSYFIHYSSHHHEGILQEQQRMAEHLISRHEPAVLKWVKTESGKLAAVIDGQEAILYEVPETEMQGLNRNREALSTGRRLASFHLRGEDYMPASSSVQGSWTYWQQRWIKRLGQLENWFLKRQQEPLKTRGDEQFLLTFPYFLGLTENAVQMVMDIQLDHPYSARNGAGTTICHDRFHEGKWLTTDETHTAVYKIPTGFVYDHFTRDAAEYVRDLAISDMVFSKKTARTERFLHRYQQVKPFEYQDACVFFARLCFPVQYFDHIEDYYRTVDEEQRYVFEEDFLKILDKAEEYECFLRAISKQIFKQGENPYMPSWLSARQHLFG